ncbi:MAG TPA: ergothioneine biosynthesis protein EgtB [Chthoniobacterales bacterium]|nr:ergothioneine biosynthesis protein EgtB [Chthoniobacterales bacterium]
MNNAVIDELAPPASVAPHHGEANRAAHLLQRYRQVRSFSERLCETLEPEDFVVQSMPDVSPTKWHLAHTSWFFETFVLKKWMPHYRTVVPEYAYLFNSYYNAAGDMHRRDLRGLISRPTVAETYRFRQSIDAHIAELLEGASEELLDEIEPVFIIGLHHEQQHQELLVTDIKHVFSQNPLHPIFREREENETRTTVPPAAFVDFAETICEIGHAGSSFSYDNEGPRHRALVPAFSLATRPVTNGEFLAFIEAGGYTKPEFWLSLGWTTVNEQRWQAPLYWEKRDGVWWNFTLSGMRPVEKSEPVTHVSYFEADAFANWSGARLPTEFEWERAAKNLPIEGNFVDTERFHPAPMENSPNERLTRMYGDVWEWTRSAYLPYPGYRAAPGALGEYNGKFMCNQMVLRGGSCATSQSHLRATYRNFFQPEKRWQFTGIRLARDPA